MLIICSSNSDCESDASTTEPCQDISMSFGIMASADDLLLFVLKLNPDAQARMLLSEQGL